MVGELTREQVDQLLRSEAIGRLGCHAEGKTYIVPINYVYDGHDIYARSISGLKLQMMRLNPEVCFEVDRIKNASNWQSVIAWGTFEELKGEDSAEPIQLLIQQLMMQVASGYSVHVPPQNAEKNTQVASIYRVRLTEISGRFERDEEAAYR